MLVRMSTGVGKRIRADAEPGRLGEPSRGQSENGRFACKLLTLGTSAGRSSWPTSGDWQTTSTAMRRDTRRGAALLQGIAVCGRCGRLMCLRYTGPNGDYPVYCCRVDRDLRGSALCQEVRALPVDTLRGQRSQPPSMRANRPPIAIHFPRLSLRRLVYVFDKNAAAPSMRPEDGTRRSRQLPLKMTEVH
jgi:hypothetical protein